MEGHWKFLVDGGVLKAKFLEEVYESKLEFPGGKAGCKTKILPWEERGAEFLVTSGNLIGLSRT